MPVSEMTYERVALEDPTGGWELVCGRLRSKPGMAIEHEHTKARLTQLLIVQLGDGPYEVRMEGPRMRVSNGNFYLPDVCVVPLPLVDRRRREAPHQLEIYDDPVPLVIEVWSPWTGDYDVEQKLGEYQKRGDFEIWRVHPYERTLTAWRNGPDGAYAEVLHGGGVVRPGPLPAVQIDLDRLFE